MRVVRRGCARRGETRSSLFNVAKQAAAAAADEKTDADHVLQGASQIEKLQIVVHINQNFSIFELGHHIPFIFPAITEYKALRQRKPYMYYMQYYKIGNTQ